MQIEPLNLSHQTIIESKFRLLHISFSEYSFANLYLFRQLHHYEVIKLQEDIFIRGITRDNTSFIMLTSHPESISIQSLQQLLPLSQILFPVPDSWLLTLDKWTVQASFKEEESDYLYHTLKLATYFGRHLDGKRNQVKQLLDHHQVKIESFAHQVKEAQDILDIWQEEHKDTQTDYSSCREAIQKFQLLHLHGFIVYVDEEPTGFIIGEWINQDCYTVHFSKALPSIKGIYQYLFQELAQSIKDVSSWMNLEQDLGIPALRYSKLSYHPDLLAKKWRVQMKIL